MHSEVSWPMTLPRKKKKKPRGSSGARTQDLALRVIHLTTEPRRTLGENEFERSQEWLVKMDSAFLIRNS